MAFLFKRKYTLIKELFNSDENNVLNTIHTVKGWIRSTRKQKDRIFIIMYDGSSSDNLQILPSEDIKDDIINEIKVGTCVSITGLIVKSPAQWQKFEMIANDIEIIGDIKDISTYFPATKKASFDTLRLHQHLRPKFRSFQSIFRIRSKLMFIMQRFFEERGVFHLDPNIITTADCEGAGEMFSISTLLNNEHITNIPQIGCPTYGLMEDLVDFEKDFFKKHAYLTVSSQLQLESLCAGLGSVYTTNKSFRSEKSKTSRHQAEFIHIEWELAFIDLKDLMDFSEDLITYSISNLLKESKSDLELLDSYVAKGLVAKLESFIKERFGRITYDEAIGIITEQKDNVLEKFNELTEIPKWGDDLGSYCERYLTEEVFKKPIFVYNYPRKLKSFYMKQNDPYEVNGEIRKTVQGCDLLLPFLGELIGSSIREENYDKLVKDMEDREMDKTPLEWYIELRKDGTFPHGGAGLGFDRFVSVVTSFGGNIRDAVPFPVAYEECSY